MPEIDVPFTAHASVTRTVRVTVPDGLTARRQFEQAREKAITAMNADEDLFNEKGTWKVNRLDGADTIVINDAPRLAPTFVQPEADFMAWVNQNAKP